MKTTGMIKNVVFIPATRKSIVTLELDTKEIGQYDELNGLKLNVELKKWYKKRSLDANGYLWELIGLISDKIDDDPISIYKRYIRELNTYYIIPVKTELVDAYRKIWEANGVGWFIETRNSKLEGYTNVIEYYGSSAYDSKEMGKLIDNVVQDCKELGIETKSPEEIRSLDEKIQHIK